MSGYLDKVLRISELAEDLLAQLPRCEQSGCGERATCGRRYHLHEPEGFYCDAHAGDRGRFVDRDLPWAAVATALEAELDALEDELLEVAMENTV